MNKMTDKFIIESFWQREGYGNCATVALIKAAIIKYGPYGIFKKIEKRGIYFIITLRSNELILISKKEIKNYNKDNGIDFEKYRDLAKRNQLKLLGSSVELCFAVMVKYLIEYGFDDEYYDWEAIETLLEYGVNTDYVHELLGLKRSRIIKLSGTISSSLRKRKAILLYTRKHAVLLSNGYYDYDGEALPISTKIPRLRNKKAKWWYQII